MRLGFVGLGNMGGPMAALIARSGRPLSVFDADPGTLARFGASEKDRAAGLTLAASAAEVGASADVAGICVRDAAQVEAVLFGERGLIGAMAPGGLVMIHSTIEAGRVETLAERAARSQVRVLECAVTRSRRDLDHPFVTAIVGGESADLEHVRQVLELFSVRIVYGGPLGAGMALKAANNLVTFLAFVAMAESHRLVSAAGADPERLRELMTENGNLTPMMQGLAAQRGNPAETRISGLRLMQKDVGVALDLAHRFGISLPATALVGELIEDAVLGPW